MAWIRLSDNYVDHPKFQALSDGAFRLWHEAMAFCRRHQTDGLIPFSTMRNFRYYTKTREKQLAVSHVESASPLWQLVPGTGYKVHDYLEWNLSKEAEQAKQMLNNHRGAFMRDKGLKQALRDRDKDLCRYCGLTVNWADRKSASGATYDHVNPVGTATLDNLVIACRGCNSKKRNRTPEAAGMVLLSEPPERRASEQKSRSDLDRITDSTGYGYGSRSDLPEKESEEKPDADALAERAGTLLQERYPAWYATYRKGARLRLVSNSLAFQDAMSLVTTWDDARIEKLARIVLTTDEPFIASTDRSFRIFAMKASWADDRLRQAESGAA